jgi:hypothetical protein
MGRGPVQTAPHNRFPSDPAIMGVPPGPGHSHTTGWRQQVWWGPMLPGIQLKGSHGPDILIEEIETLEN